MQNRWQNIRGKIDFQLQVVYFCNTFPLCFFLFLNSDQLSASHIQKNQHQKKTKTQTKTGKKSLTKQNIKHTLKLNDENSVSTYK